jgi:cobalt-zinc-cadmium efflux system outer membrane protein
MKKLLLMLWIGMTCTLSTLAQSAPPQRFTLDQALRILRTSSPVLRANQAHLEAVQAGEVTAGLRVNPVASLANQDFRAFSASQFVPAISNAQEFTDSLAYTFERGGKRRSRVASARAATAVQRDLDADAQRQLEFQLKSTFVGFVLAKQQLVLAGQNLSEYQQAEKANQLRLDVGDISQTDFDRIRIDEARYQSDLFNAQAAVGQARAQLGALLGYSDSRTLDVESTLDVPQLALALDSLNATALDHRTDYLAARDTVTRNAADSKLAQANGATDLTFQPEYKRNGPDNTLGVTFAFAVRIYDRNQGEKLRAQRELESSRFAENASRLQVFSDVSQAWEAYQSALSAQRLYSSDYLQRAKDVRERMTFSYEHGATNLLDYLDAVRAYRDVELSAISANAQVLTAIHQLSFATATELLP